MFDDLTVSRHSRRTSYTLSGVYQQVRYHYIYTVRKTHGYCEENKQYGEAISNRKNLSVISPKVDVQSI